MTQSAEANVELGRAWVNAFNAGDVEIAAELRLRAGRIASATTLVDPRGAA